MRTLRFAPILLLLASFQTFAADSIHIKLVNARQSGPKHCTYIWEITNNTLTNFSQLRFNLVFKDKSGNIMDKPTLAERVPPKSTVIHSRLFDCVAQMQWAGFAHTTEIDGEFVRGAKEKALYAIPVNVSSKIKIRLTK